ncbi:lysophospholipase [Gordonia sp. Z-3]|uniref:alpha/beta hydrolase n=1 Tax=unclassified Gordonia (in: high G+C Gram-positive bacteria) TaxID=2657482 RepID=UPI000C597395|nr:MULTISPECIES: alpha/beta hydrolase [unclassified Gordonia (in: high G+C Gram-positive bacteria)]MAU80811.1 lysophospholipase [Gordonia sp. (in: high G+C Gram-positive bacteria)]MED5803621.1 lysophospholipase [Gordonia sp. Z-3]
MQRVEHSFVGGHRETITYDVIDPIDQPRAVVVIAHGLGEHGRRYTHVVDRLVAAGNRTVVPDHLGHGRSGGKRLRLRRFADFTDDLDRVIGETAVADRPTFLVGHSMGGCIALDYALDHQDRLAGLALSGAAVVPGDDMSPIAMKLAPVLARVAPGLPTTALDASAISRDPRVVADYNADPLVIRRKIPADLGAAMLTTMQSFPRRLPRLQLPLLVMHGGDDVLTSPAGSELVERLAGSSDKTLTIYDGLYHEIFNEPERDRVITDVVDWLAAHTPA